MTPGTGTPDTEYFLSDALGSVRKLTDSADSVTYSASYSPYGEVSQAGGMYSSTSCGEVPVGNFSAQEKKSARSLMVCFLALECGYWQVSQSWNGVSLVCIVPSEDSFSGGYHQERSRQDG